MSAPKCEKHSNQITHFGNDFDALAKEIGDLRYDALHELLLKLSNKIKEDANKDREGGRVILSDNLYSLSEMLDFSSKRAKSAWDICEPFMEKK